MTQQSLTIPRELDGLINVEIFGLGLIVGFALILTSRLIVDWLNNK